MQFENVRILSPVRTVPPKHRLMHGSPPTLQIDTDLHEIFYNTMSNQFEKLFYHIGSNNANRALACPTPRKRARWHKKHPFTTTIASPPNRHAAKLQPNISDIIREQANRHVSLVKTHKYIHTPTRTRAPRILVPHNMLPGVRF